MRKLIATLAFGTLLFSGALPAQQVRIPGLENHTEYTDLLSRQQELHRSADSTQTAINNIRTLFRDTQVAASERQQLAEEMVSLEGKLFEIRNQIGRITAQVAAIEQEYLLSSMGGGAVPSTATDPEPSSGGQRTLFANAFFQNNLSREDIRLFLQTPKVGPEVAKMEQQVETLYQELEETQQAYTEARTQEEIDSLLLRGQSLKSRIEETDSYLERLWEPIYTRKMDAYPLLIDRIGTDRLTLEQLDQHSRQTRRAEGLAARSLTPLLLSYPYQKRLILDYEIAMATKLGLTLALDSLQAEQKTLPSDGGDMSVSYPDVVFTPRSLVVFGPIVSSGGETYESLDEVPVLHVPQKGLYYAIQLGVYTTPPKSVDVFKGMNPLRKEQLSDGRIRYTVGGFATHAEAQAAQTQMTRAGFRAPTIVAWNDGEFTTVAKARAAETAAASAPASQEGPARFKVDIIPSEARLTAEVREIINSRAGGKPIVRSTVDNTVVYSVSGFAERGQAEALVEALRTQSNVKLNIVEL